MNLDNYINKLCKKNYGNLKSNLDIKDEIKEILIENVNELKKQGYSEEESVKIAINNFGEIKEIRKDLNQIMDYSLKPFIYLLITSLIVFFISMIILIYFKNTINHLKLPIIIISIPIYIITRSIFIIYLKNKNNNYYINFKKEIIQFLFIIYIIFLIGRYIFPLNFSGNSVNKIELNLIPFNTLYNEILKREFNGLPLLLIINGIVKNILLFIPVGSFIVFIYNKKIKFIYSIVLSSSIYFITIILKYLFIILGINSSILSISLDYFILNMIGTTLGFIIAQFFYSKLEIEKIN